MRILPVLSLPLLAGCAALKEAGSAVVDAGNALVSGGAAGPVADALESGNPGMILGLLQSLGLPAGIVTAIGALFAVPATRARMIDASKAAGSLVRSLTWDMVAGVGKDGGVPGKKPKG